MIICKCMLIICYLNSIFPRTGPNWSPPIFNRTGNPNVRMISYLALDTLDAKQVEKCANDILIHKRLKKNNEIYCTSLESVYKVINDCICSMEHLIGISDECRQVMPGVILEKTRGNCRNSIKSYT